MNILYVNINKNEFKKILLPALKARKIILIIFSPKAKM